MGNSMSKPRTKQADSNQTAAPPLVVSMNWRSVMP